MKKNLILVLGSFLIFSGCIDLEEKISIRNDGSGSYKVNQVLSKELTSMMQMGMKGGNTRSALLLSQEELKKKFQGEGVEIKSSSFNIVDGRLKGEYHIDFQNAEAFFKVPAMEKRFRFYREGDELVLQSIPNSNMKPDIRQFSPPVQQSSSSVSMAATQVNQLQRGDHKDLEAALQKSMKNLFSNFKVAISVELPNNIIDSNATQSVGRLAKWTIDEKMFTDPEKLQSLGDHLWVKCSLNGLGFKPPKKEDITSAGAPQLKRDANLSLRSEVATASRSTTKPESATTKSTPPAKLSSGGRSIVHLKNGNLIDVDGYYKEGNMITFMKHDGTFSLPVSIIEAVKAPEYEE